VITADFLIIGAGIVGITIARELKSRYPNTQVVILEKEPASGRHSSGRNSGVLHSGIYYPSGSLKAKICAEGARELAEYCEERKLPLIRSGKILVPVDLRDAPQFEFLVDRAVQSGIYAERLDEKHLHELEPEVQSATGNALLIPSTSVVSSGRVMQSLTCDVDNQGVIIKYSTHIVKINPACKTMHTNQGQIDYGHVINAAGLHADTVAHRFDVGHRYTLFPFKGIYWKLRPDAGLSIRHLIYPVPDLRVPFLGVHTTTSTDGITYLGPTAVPALGRENYRGLEGVRFGELIRIGGLLVRQYASGRDGFRRLAWQEGRRYFKHWFAQAATALLPRLKPEYLQSSDKVGIRAQMLDRQTGRLVTDFVVERGRYSTHVLNAISPAFTCSFPLARHIVNEFIEKR